MEKEDPQAGSPGKSERKLTVKQNRFAAAYTNPAQRRPARRIQSQQSVSRGRVTHVWVAALVAEAMASAIAVVASGPLIVAFTVAERSHQRSLWGLLP